MVHILFYEPRSVQIAAQKKKKKKKKKKEKKI